MKQSLGIIEVKGLVYTIACADAALKAANVKLLGYETSRGGACFVLKFTGNVGAVRAALDAALALAGKDGKEITGYAIPRPSEGCWEIVNTENAFQKKEEGKAEAKANEDSGAEAGEDEKTGPEAEAETGGVRAEPETEAECLVRAGVCNLCNDPKCPRRKSEPHNLCIHFEENNK